MSKLIIIVEVIKYFHDIHGNDDDEVQEHLAVTVSEVSSSIMLNHMFLSSFG